MSEGDGVAAGGGQFTSGCTRLMSQALSVLTHTQPTSPRILSGALQLP